MNNNQKIVRIGSGPDLRMRLLTEHVGGSRRRGRNASNRHFAAVLVYQARVERALRAKTGALS